MTLLLRDYGVDVNIAGNGLDVFDMYKKGGYDRILMDINMPVADGFETAKMIMEYEDQSGIPHVPIIALTAKVLKSDMDTMSECGMDGFLSKPVEMDRLESVLARYLTIEIVRQDRGEECAGESHPAAESGAYDIREVAAELKIPVNVLESIGRDFFEEAAHSLIELRRAHQESDLEMVRILSHKMKGAAANLRFNTVSELLSAVEENSSVADKEFDYAACFDNIKSELSAVRSVFY
jgi:CheY-like chemotaxis protein